MNEETRAGMDEATRLTRAGRLWEATALIQRLLGGASTPEPAGAYASGPDATIIEGEFQVTEPASSSGSAAPPRHRLSLVLPPPAPASVPGATIVRPHPVEAPAAPQGRQQAPSRDRPRYGTFLSAAYSGPAGTRPYKLYVPSGYQGQPLPLVVMLHGCTQSPDDLAAGTRMNALAEEFSCLVAYPAQVRAANRSACWNWFEPGDQRRGEGEPSLIAGIVEQIAGGYAVDPRRMFIAGMSAGGAMAVILGMTYPELFAAVGCHSGLAYGAAYDLPSALAAMSQGRRRPERSAPTAPPAGSSPQPVPLIVFHGDQDTTVHPRNTDQLVAQWAAHYGGTTRPHVTMHQGQAGGLAYSRASYKGTGGQTLIERWLINGAGHAWSGGSPEGSFTNPAGPDAAREMLHFFLAHPKPER